MMLQLEETDVSSRYSARKMRNTIEALTKESSTICLDFSIVESISEAYADELFGVLLQANGFAWLNKHVIIINCREAVLRNIAITLLARINA